MIGLFAGIGGLELGLSKAGYETTALCEIDPAAQHVLKVRFPKVDLLEDVRKVGGIGSVDVLCAGFPCQDLSSVGQKTGISGSRSTLIDEVFRILAISNVDWVVVENVRFMLHLNKGEAMTRLVTGFEALGYRWAYRVVDSQAFGVPQRRHRVYFVASRSGDPRNVLLSDDAVRPDSALSALSLDDHIGFYWTEGAYAAGLSKDAIPPLKAGSTIGIPSPPAIMFPDGVVGTPAIGDADRLQGFAADWTKPAEEIGKASARWRLLGNSVTVPVAEWIGKRLRRSKHYDATRDLPISGKWPNAAWSMGHGRFAANCSDWPLATPLVKIGDFLKHDPKPLSHKAVTGFLKRAYKGNLHYPTGFLDALDKFAINVG
ncbi:DNA (cytosine-5-)-methyltransferase [Paraburkholderia sp. T12-10]|nr:DNA (cytosine-5-)-methyltransferase [Paraburkholderia sp. T12-10]